MCLEEDSYEMFFNEYRNMDREDLKAIIDYWEEAAEWSHQLQILDIAKQELERRNKEREEQIELLTKSLSSSSRLGRWISSGKAVIRKFVELKLSN